MFSRHDSIQELPAAPQLAPFPTAPSRVACLPEYFMYCNYLKRLGTRQSQASKLCIVDKSLKIIYKLIIKNAVRLILDNFGIVGFLFFGRIPVDSSHFSLHFDSILSPKRTEQLVAISF
jgi:hypothetical protein